MPFRRASRLARPDLVTVMLRGALDGLAVLVPHRDPGYARLRRSTRLPDPGSSEGVLPLTDDLGLHPALAPLLPLYREGHLSFVAGFGSPLEGRSHFEARRLMELGTLSSDRQIQGFLGRVAGALPQVPGRPTAIFATSDMPLVLRGDAPTLSLGPLASRPSHGRDRRMAKVSELCPHEGDAVLTAGHRSLTMLTALQPSLGSPSNTDAYPRGALGPSLANIARLVRADLGISLFYTEASGWNTHVNQDAAQGQLLARKLAPLGATLAAFDADLGPARRDVVLVCITEFGRTVRENGSRGTDHGHGSAALVLGERVAGGRVLEALPSLDPSALYEARDLPVVVDHRDAFAEILRRHVGVPSDLALFSDITVDAARFPGLFSAG